MESELLYNVNIGIIKYMPIFYFSSFSFNEKTKVWLHFASKTPILARKSLYFYVTFKIIPAFSGEIIKERYVVGDKITIELIFLSSMMAYLF